MKRFNDIRKLLKNMPLNSAILVLALVVSGAFLAPTDSIAQAVPPRVQGLMINKPLVPPPEPPVQKEIGELKQRVQANKIELDRKIEVHRRPFPTWRNNW